MKWSHTLIAGGTLILLVNAVVLLGVAYNRSDDPESQLQLTQREFQHLAWREGKENSGITLALDWRFEQEAKKGSDLELYSGRWGAPAWLNQAKMSELGFSVNVGADTAERGRKHREEQAREALLVLELDGKAYQHQLQRAGELAEQARVLLKTDPNSVALMRKAQAAEENLQHEQRKSSRLFVIDAGLDMHKLRAAYSDRSRYAILRGLIRPTTVFDGNTAHIEGHISDLYGERINVPLAYRQMFTSSAIYKATIAFGKRQEPWITAATNSETEN